MYQRIMLATDGSATSRLALQEAAKLAKEGSQLKVVTVVTNPVVTMPSPYGINYDASLLRNAVLESGRAALEENVKTLEDMGLKPEGCLIDLSETVGSNIATSLLDEAKDWPADLIVIGTHGHKGFKRFLLGSVAEELIRRADIPVLLVKGKEE